MIDLTTRIIKLNVQYKLIRRNTFTRSLIQTVCNFPNHVPTPILLPSDNFQVNRLNLGPPVYFIPQLMRRRYDAAESDMGARRIFFRGAQTQRLVYSSRVEGYICIVSILVEYQHLLIYFTL